MRMTMLAAMSVAALAAPAMAAPVISFNGGVGGTAPGTTVIQNYDSLTTGSSIGSFAYVYSGNSSKGLRPAYGSTGNYASVLGGGRYSIDFGPADTFSFVVGSLDQFNLLTLSFSDGSTADYWGNAIIGGRTYVNGSATSPLSNGLVSFSTGSGPRIVGATFRSSTNSFEFDNLAINAVPEPATWALMILGFGAIGGALRRRKVRGAVVTA